MKKSSQSIDATQHIDISRHTPPNTATRASNVLCYCASSPSRSPSRSLRLATAVLPGVDVDVLPLAAAAAAAAVSSPWSIATVLLTVLLTVLTVLTVRKGEELPAATAAVVRCRKTFSCSRAVRSSSRMVAVALLSVRLVRIGDLLLLDDDDENLLLAEGEGERDGVEAEDGADVGDDDGDDAEPTCGVGRVGVVPTPPPTACCCCGCCCCIIADCSSDCCSIEVSFSSCASIRPCVASTLSSLALTLAISSCTSCTADRVSSSLFPLPPRCWCDRRPWPCIAPGSPSARSCLTIQKAWLVSFMHLTILVLVSAASPSVPSPASFDRTIASVI